MKEPHSDGRPGRPVTQPQTGTTHGSGGEGDGAHGGSHMPQMDPAQEPGLIMTQHHDMVRWVDLVLMGLGVWLLTSPFTLGYERVPLIGSDLVSGALVLAFAGLSFWGRKTWAPWGAVLVGTWLVFAPVFFWAHEPGAYANNTLVGALVIGFAILIPHGTTMPGPQLPPGWSYNPATWAQRMPIIALGLFGFLVSRPMAAYPMGHIDGVWDPFFGEGTVRILGSEVSKMFPVSDAGIGASVYLLEVLMTAMGDARRWRTMPWMVAFFAVLVVPLGVTSIVLVILQPLAVGAWCTLCLLAALAMLAMVPLTLDEVVAMGQFLLQQRRAGKSLWRTFWLGANLPEEEQTRPTRPTNSSAPAATVWGLTLPWNLLTSALLGGWLLLGPAVLGSEGSRLADADRLLGALVITFSFIALAEVARAVRFLNALFGVALILAPLLLGGSAIALVSDVLVGLLLIGLSLPRGSVRETYGGWDRYVR